MQISLVTQTASVSDGLYQDILSGILLGDYPPQSTLPTEAQLAMDYGLSRAVVRSALERLKKEGVVQSRQGSGTVVAAFDPGRVGLLNLQTQIPELKNCYACRLAIEPEIAAQVAAEPSAAARDYLLAQLDAHKTEVDPLEGPVNVHSARDADFHIRLAELSGNTFFAAIMRSLRPHMLFAMNVTKCMGRGAQSSHMALARLEHVEVIRAILRLDPTQARDAMRNHIDQGRQRIFQHL